MSQLNCICTFYKIFTQHNACFSIFQTCWHLEVLFDELSRQPCDQILTSKQIAVYIRRSRTKAPHNSEFIGEIQDESEPNSK